jgi:undecaprenyl-phosphate 4-deoxy-4-formamido-L-arabinose transferase
MTSPTLDADLHNPPEEIPKLLSAIAAGHDPVGGDRQDRQDTFFRKFSSRVINGIRAKITRIHMRDQGCMLRSYRRNIGEYIVRMYKEVRKRPRFVIREMLEALV